MEEALGAGARYEDGFHLSISPSTGTLGGIATNAVKTLAAD